MRCTRFLHTSHYKLRFCPAFVSFATVSSHLLPRTTTARFDDTRRARRSKANAEGGAKSFPFPCSCPRVFCRRTDIPLVARAGIFRGFVEGPMRLRNTAHKVPTPLLCSCTQWLCTTPSKIEYREKKTRGLNEKEPPLPNPPFRRREAADGGVKTGFSRGITPLISVVQWHCPKGVYTTPTPLLCSCTQ